MSKRELGRVGVLSRVRSRDLRVVDAVALLGVSSRQAKRLWKRYREEGAAGLKHRSARPRSPAPAMKPSGTPGWLYSSGLVLAFNTTWIVRANEAVLYDSFVLPQWRGQGIHSCLDVAFNSYVRARGIVHTLASMAALNSQALSLAKRSGKPIIMTAVLVRFRGVKRTWRTAMDVPLESCFQVQSS